MAGDPAKQMSLPLDGGSVELMAGGAYEGADRFLRALASWQPPTRSVDGDVIPGKRTADARALDLARNDAYAAAGIAAHKDSIVGAFYRLNAKPRFKYLGLDKEWAKEFAEEVEEKFTVWAEDPYGRWADASRRNTFTDLIRLAVGTMCHSGEVLATVEWLREGVRPYRTAIQMVELNRLCNPGDQNFDRKQTRGGIRFSARGVPLGYWIRRSAPGTFYDALNAQKWAYIRAETSFGRPQVIHLVEQDRAGQSRGMTRLVAALKETRMARNLRDVLLENAVVNASFAAAIESDLPSEQVFQALGSGAQGSQESIIEYAEAFMNVIASYGDQSRNMHINGVKIPHLMPGTKLNLQPAGRGTEESQFEQSLLRYLASSFDMSVEQFTKDWSRTNYSSTRAAAIEVGKAMRSKKRHCADSLAGLIFRLWFEEAVNAQHIEAMQGATVPNMYDAMNMRAFTNSQWIGSGQGQIEELKETQAAVLRIKAGLSTFEDECGRLGKDWQQVFEQRQREEEYMKESGMEIMLPDVFGTKDSEETPQPGQGQ